MVLEYNGWAANPLSKGLLYGYHCFQEIVVLVRRAACFEESCRITPALLLSSGMPVVTHEIAGQVCILPAQNRLAYVERRESLLLMEGSHVDVGATARASTARLLACCEKSHSLERLLFCNGIFGNVVVGNVPSQQLQ